MVVMDSAKLSNYGANPVFVLKISSICTSNPFLEPSKQNKL